MILDTNVLLRASIDDDPAQTSEARALVDAAERLVISNTTLCEYAWVANRNYKESRKNIADAIRALIADPRTIIDGDAVTAGLAFLDAGGDFADGVIEFEGRRLGGKVFATFDRQAAAIVRAQGRQCLLLGAE
ncbi:putative nucleic-acid-binding protein [Neorhizobium huautlense]|uniref:Ribonuclease VapC n=1 Tax=Neorhizobium huautlense TaxID=67774 RepID=A0ABT9PZT7_9HYPH|nr:type II toxin-antitoxin system VapC family toxin [Neorhizobium huautlense]MDP9839996.1 putative nucleic-acid-binding protein [Neorhizobium huautlense]